MFLKGTASFIGDYIDVAVRQYKPNLATNTYVFITSATDAQIFHPVWTDNRDVRPPADGNWANFTPPGITSAQSSIFLSGSTVSPCVTPGNQNDRNQNVYTARLLTQDFEVGALANAKVDTSSYYPECTGRDNKPAAIPFGIA